ncbi:hypothetical protein NL50_17435 [Clostridium acetobutylicum]|nr:hypothetical protein NL50_17435 [Clostridium acetobutylicum]
MYKIILINGTEQTTIHYPSAENNPCRLFKADLDEKESQISQLTIDIPFFNPGYNKLYSRATLIRVIRVKDNVTTFRGRLIDFQEHMDDNSNPFYKECIFESELGYLCDTQVRPQSISDMSPHDLLVLLINNHNSHSDKQFLIGTIDMEDRITTNLEYSTTLNSILTNLVNVQGGIIQLRYGANDVRYIDYVSSTGVTNNTTIALAKNMKSMIWEPDTTNIATRIIPVGKDNLNIASVNNNIDYLENADAVNQYGIVEQVLKLDDIEDANVLKQKGQDKLTEMSKAEVKLSVEAYDLSTIGVDASSFYISDNVNVQNPIIGFNDTFRVIEKTTDLLQSHNITLTFANKFERLADKQVQMQRAANFVNQISDKNGVNTYFLRNAIDATRNMVIASGAYKNKKYIENQGILFENTDETDASFGAMYIAPTGFMISNTKDSSGNWEWTTFGTGGGFTANLINAGTLLADRIAGGTLSSVDGSLKISLEDGKFTLTQNGQRAISLEGESINWYDWQQGASLTGRISSNRLVDAQGNPTGAPVFSAGIPRGVFYEIASMENDINYPIVRVDNYVSDSSKQVVNFFSGVYCEQISLNKTRTGANVWTGDVTIDGMKMTFIDGLLVNAVKQ